MKTSILGHILAIVMFILAIVMFILAIIIGFTVENLTIMWLVWGGGWIFFFIGLYFQQEEDSAFITEKDLNKLTCFGRENDGSYCDRWEFSIVPIKDKDKKITKWVFCFFNEVDGSTIRIKNVKTMKELKLIYEAVSDKPLN